jgi:hypothetical protein
VSKFDDAANLVQAVTDNADRLGLTWGLRPATVKDFDIATNVATAIYDGDKTAIGMVSLTGPLLPGFRVMGMSVPPSGNFAIATLGLPEPGTLVLKIRQTVAQSLTDAANTFINFDTTDHNFFGKGFTSGTPDRWVPPLAGYYQFVGRVVYASNATSRRFAGLNTNGSTSGTGTIGSQSLQAAGTGTTQIQAVGAVYMNGTTDYIGLRAIQNSGAALNTSTSDGGSSLEAYYAGAFLPMSQ